MRLVSKPFFRFQPVSGEICGLNACVFYWLIINEAKHSSAVIPAQAGIHFKELCRNIYGAVYVANPMQCLFIMHKGKSFVHGRHGAPKGKAGTCKIFRLSGIFDLE
jgi:hypothetical protein